MKYCIIIPAYNEEKFISLTLKSLLAQTVLPEKVIIVNDNSTDKTAIIISEFIAKDPIFSLVNNVSSAVHLPGSKVVQAFYKGFETINFDYDVIVKLDADLILPANYFERILEIFAADATIGMVGGFAYIEKDGKWILENLTDKDHIRGAFKAYRKKCFEDIGGLRPEMGWDTVDELLCKFYKWKVVTDQSLKVKHLKPTGANYNKSARYKQGEAFYKLGYGFWITVIASAKLSYLKKKPHLFLDYIKGFWFAKNRKTPLLVTQEQAKFIRNYRWKNIKNKFVR